MPRFNSLAGFEIGLGAYINTVYPEEAARVPARGGQRMNVVILWHMHQPYYVNPLTKKAMMPWVRLHAAKGYLDMIDLVTAQPELRVNFNFTPVLVRQILELVNREVAGRVGNSQPQARRRPRRRGPPPSPRKFFQDQLGHARPPGSRATPNCWPSAAPTTPSTSSTPSSALSATPISAISRLLYNLQWCGFSAVRRFPVLQELKDKGRDFTEEEKNAVLDIHRQDPRPRAAANTAPRPERGQIELTTTPYFHPIMPLVYDTNIARRCQPQSPLPSAFSAPEDVRAQLRLAQELHEKVFGQRARGLWPSEGSIAPEIVPLMVEAGFDYFCSDEGNLFQSLKHDPGLEHTATSSTSSFSRAGASTPAKRSIQALFRDRPLSDFIGFDAARNETSKRRRPSHRQPQKHRQGRPGRSRRRLR